MKNNVSTFVHTGGDVERLSCPVCGKKNASEHKVMTRDYHGMRDIVPFAAYEVFACPECGMVYAGNMEVSMELGEYYAKMSRYEGKSFVLSPKVQGLYAREAEFLAQHVSREAKILDVGCAFGGLLGELRKKGFTNLYGLEPSAENAHYAKEHFGAIVHQGGLGMGTHLEETFDLVILSAVLEHLLDLHAAVRELKSYLRPGGRLFFVVPELADFPHHRDLYQEFSIEHINYFSIPALKNLMRPFGFRLEAMMEDTTALMGLAGNSFTLFTDGAEELQPAEPDFEALKQYLTNSQAVASAIRTKLQAKDFSQGFYIWAAGTQTAMLYQLGLFPQEAVRGIFDANRNLWGEEIFSLEVMSPERLKDLPPLPVLISSAYAQEAIKKQMKEMALENPVWDIW